MRAYDRRQPLPSRIPVPPAGGAIDALRDRGWVVLWVVLGVGAAWMFVALFAGIGR